MSFDTGITNRYQTLQVLRGSAYTTERASFLLLPDVESFLKSAIEKSPQDFLLYALDLRLRYPQVAAESDILLPTSDPYEDEGLSVEVLEAEKFKRLKLALLRAYDIAELSRTHKVALHNIYALILESFLHNPKNMSANYRIWYTQFFLSKSCYPIYQKDMGSVLSGRAQYNKIFVRNLKKLDVKLLHTWLDTLLRRENVDDVLSIFAALRLSGDHADAVLIRLAQRDGLLGVMAALRYAGTWSNGDRGFNGVWIESWVKEANQSHLHAVEALFLAGGQPWLVDTNYLTQLRQTLSRTQCFVGSP